jgi:Flp pilus assembly protein TadB
LIVLAALWAAVLVPATLNSRTAAHDDRTINGFSTAMRTLSRRSATATADSRRVLVPTLSVTDDRRKARRERLRRRRVMLGRLLWTAVGTATLAVLLGGPWVPIHLLVDVALVGALVWLRRAAIEEDRVARLERRAAAAERERLEHDSYLAAREERMRQRGEMARLAAAPRENRRRAVGD